MHTCLMYIKFHAIKPATVVKCGNHIFEWVMGFKVKRLVAFHCITGRMALGESKIGKGFYLEPYITDSFFGVSFFSAIRKKFLFYCKEFIALFKLPRHTSTETISFS